MSCEKAKALKQQELQSLNQIGGQNNFPPFSGISIFYSIPITHVY